MVETKGIHFIVEGTTNNKEILSNLDKLKDLLMKSAKFANMEIKGEHFFKFGEKGVSGVVIVAESHISIHTWPEHNYFALDIYTCGKKAKPDKAIDFLLKELNSDYHFLTKIERGIKDKDKFIHKIEKNGGAGI